MNLVFEIWTYVNQPYRKIYVGWNGGGGDVATETNIQITLFIYDS